MPSERFHQLKPVKKKNFLRYAYQEFALHAYEGASISKLVSTLKMAKGSIYQYFEDKEDLYYYLLSHTREQLQTLLEQACPLPAKNSSFKNWYRNFLVVQLKYYMSLPSQGLLLLRYQADTLGIISLTADNPQSTYLMRAANRMGETLSKQKIHQLDRLPLLVFDYLLNQHPTEVDSWVKGELALTISPQELIDLCDHFLE